MYKVIYSFYDKQNNDHVYRVGHDYPFDNSKPTKKRTEELKTDKNEIGRPLIEEVKESTEKVEEVTEE